MPKDSLPNDSISKCLKTLQILAVRGELRVSDLSRELDVAVSTAHRLLNILRIHEFAEQDPRSRRYVLGPAAFGLARYARGEQNLISAAREHLEKLAATVDETVNLVVLEGPDILFVDGVEARQALRVATRTGARVPAYSAAGGKVLLARLTFSNLRARYADGLVAVTETTVTDLATLERELDEVRRVGYATNRGEHLVDINAIGVAVEGIGTTAVAALTIAVPISRWSLERLVQLAPLLHEVSAAITRDLRRSSATAPRRQSAVALASAGH